MLDRDAIVSVVQALDLPPGEWAVHASAVLVLNGLIDAAGDVDVVARGAAWRRALQLGTPVRGKEDVCVALAGGQVEVWSGWLGEDVDELIEGARPAHGVPCVSLEAVLRFKEAAGRDKDAPHVEALRRALAARREPR